MVCCLRLVCGGSFLGCGFVQVGGFVDWFGMVNSVVLVSFYDFYSLLFNLLFSMFALVLACLVCFWWRGCVGVGAIVVLRGSVGCWFGWLVFILCGCGLSVFAII